MIDKLIYFLNIYRYKSDHILFRIFFTIGYIGFVWRNIETQYFVLSPANLTMLTGVSGIILTFIWTKKRK